MNKDQICEKIFLELYNSIIQNNIEQIKQSLKGLISLLIHLEDKLSLENRAIIFDLFERSPQNYKIDNKFITKYERESAFYKLIKENDISISDEIMNYLTEIENMLNKEYISFIENDLNKVSISLNVNSFDSFLRQNYPYYQIEKDYQHYKETNRTPFSLPFINGYFQKTEPELKILYYRLTELLNKTFDAIEFNKIKFGTIEQFNRIIKIANETNKPQHEAIFKDYVNELNKFEYTKPFKLTDSEIKEIRKKTQRLDDFQIFNLILKFVEKTAFNEFNQMQIEELNNLKEPNQKIIFNEMAKKQIVNDFKNDIGIQNTVLNVNPSTAQLSKRIALMIDLKIWDIYKNSLSEKDLNINQQQGNSKSFMEVFPFYKTFLNVPMNHKNLYLIIDNVEQVFKYLEIEKNSNFIKGFDRPHISYKTERNFFKLIKSFSDEVANNIEEKKLSFINLPIRVKELNNLLNKCIELIEKYKDDFFKVEMHDPYFDKDCNWYKLIYKDLQIIKGILEGYLRELKIQNSIEVNSTVNIESNFENKDDNNHIEKFILEEFNNMHKDNWKYAFINESDFLKFVKILTCYFQNIQYELPNEPIKLKRGCKTVLSRVFNPIHKEFKTIKLKHDNEYLNIIRVLEHFNKLSDASIYKDITR